MAWNNSVVTNAGLALLSDVLSGGMVTISNAAIGEGTVDVTALMAQTELQQKNDTVTVNIAAESNLTDGIGKAIRLQVRNTGLKAAVTARQFGIYATADDGSTALLAIMQDETGEEIPSEEEYPDFMLEFTAAIALSQTDGITVVVSGSAAITAETLKEALHYKADKDHSHDIADVDGLQTALNGKSNSSHSHAISDVMGLQTVLDGKANISGKPVVTSIVPMDGAVKLSWLPVEGATQYAVSLYNTSTGKYTVLNKTLTATDYTATGLTNGTEYQFLVQACLNDTWSKYAVSDHVYAIPEKINAPASATAEGYVTTGSQTFAGTKTFKGSILCGGSHNLDVAQARAIYAGTTDMIAGETYLPTGAIYLVYE